MKYQLREIATVHGGGRLKLSGQHFVQNGFDAYGAAGINGRVNVAEYMNKQAIILSSVGARCGKAFLADGAWTSLANTQVIIPDASIVNPRFLWYQLNDESRWPRSGTAQPFIKPSAVKAHEIWVPDVQTQMLVLRELDTINSLILATEARSAHLIDLRRRILQDAFGPVVNGSSNTIRLGDICRPKQWPTVSKAQMRSTGYPVYGANGVIGYYDSFNHAKPVLLIGCRGTIGSVHVTPGKSYVTGNAMALDDLDEGRTPMGYLAAFLTWRGFADLTTGTAQPQLTRGSLVGVEVPMLHESLQFRISKAWFKLDKADRLNTRFLSEVNLLMAASRHRAFRGEL